MFLNNKDKEALLNVIDLLAKNDAKSAKIMDFQTKSIKSLTASIEGLLKMTKELMERVEKLEKEKKK